MPDSDSGSSDGEQIARGEAFAALNGYGDDDMMGGTPPKIEEHIFFATLSEANPLFKFEGCDDAESTLILRRATLDGECDDDKRHVIQVISLDHADNRTVGTLCSLKLDGSCTVALDGICVAPPTAFKLVKGKGPLTICGNLMKEVDQDLMPGEDGLDSGESEEEMVDDSEEESTPAITPETVSATVDALKEIDSKIKKRKAAAPIADDDSDTDSESVEAAEPTPTKKSKKEKNGVASQEPKVNGEAKKKDAKPKKERVVLGSADELIEAVKTYKGGRPKKQAKFINWVKNTMRCDNEDWAKQAFAAVGQN